MLNDGTVHSLPFKLKEVAAANAVATKGTTLIPLLEEKNSYWLLAN